MIYELGLNADIMVYSYNINNKFFKNPMDKGSQIMLHNDQGQLSIQILYDLDQIWCVHSPKKIRIVKFWSYMPFLS